MTQLIAWIILVLSAIGAIYAVGLIIAFIAIGSDKDLYDDDLPCDCERCNK